MLISSVHVAHSLASSPFAAHRARAFTKATPISPLESTDTRGVQNNPRRIILIRKRWGEGVVLPLQTQMCFLEVSLSSAPDSLQPRPKNQICSPAPCNVPTCKRSTCQRFLEPSWLTCVFRTALIRVHFPAATPCHCHAASHRILLLLWSRDSHKERHVPSHRSQDHQGSGIPAPQGNDQCRLRKDAGDQ